MRLLPDCRDMSRALSEARDTGRALRLRERLHLLICDVCRRVRAQFALLGIAAAKPPEAGPTLSTEAKERLRRRLQE